MRLLLPCPLLSAAAQVEPYFCYLVMATQLAVYAAGTWLAVAQGPESAEQWAMALALQPSEVLGHGESWRLLTSLLLHGGLTHLALDTFFLGWMGPGESTQQQQQRQQQGLVAGLHRCSWDGCLTLDASSNGCFLNAVASYRHSSGRHVIVQSR
jgi:hypothetical protein